MQEREKFGSRIGFILISAGCAIGLGNVWRFPYIVGKNGGAIFVLIYLLFLMIIGLPILVMEFAVGRASQRSCAASFQQLEPKGTKWHYNGYMGIAGNYLLMMFYTTVAGWMFAYCYKFIAGDFNGLAGTEAVNGVFAALQSNPGESILWMAIVVLIGFGVCSLGLKNGVEKITKIMMLLLLVLIVVLAINSLLLEGGGEGVKFYLVPDFDRVNEIGWATVIYEAMGQAFFTLSIGCGSMAIFGSYLKKDRSLTGEAIHVTLLDTGVAFVAGLIIFPACFAFNVPADSGPGLIFQTLPNVFNAMEGGRVWGSLFFLFMSFAALSTVIAVFENIISISTDTFKCKRWKAILVNLVLIFVLSLPCVLGFSLLSGVQPFGEGSTIMDLEDFIVSNNLLPLGSLFYLLFCVTKKGWGWENFLEEANTGKGLKYPRHIKIYLTYVLPLVIIFILIMGYVDKFAF